jgi:hypothetical protein
MILSKETFLELWNAFVEKPREVAADQRPAEITNGLSPQLAELLKKCANGDDTCFADEISPM